MEQVDRVWATVVDLQKGVPVEFFVRFKVLLLLPAQGSSVRCRTRSERLLRAAVLTLMNKQLLCGRHLSMAGRPGGPAGGTAIGMDCVAPAVTSVPTSRAGAAAA